ncbi:MAG: squalene--hopene cyclase [Deltaproteobacteria bacterium]|nr:squalene--hopene cyclase [Deltaproteobacteria bacterium]
MNQNSAFEKVTPLHGEETLKLRLGRAIEKSSQHLFSQQYADGFWWYTLEANESIAAEFIFLLYYLGISHRYPIIIQGLCKRILSRQRDDGSWALYHDGPADLSTSVECYAALKMAHHCDLESEPMQKARRYILRSGGITQTRVFSKIHFAMFGIVPWTACPSMPLSFVLLPKKSPINIYEFSSWARACIVPLLVIMERKKVITIEGFHLEELFVEKLEDRNFALTHEASFISYENFFVQIDKVLKISEPLWSRLPLQKWARKKAEKWIISHIERTEDIYPAMAYALIALNNLGHPLEDRIVQKCLKGLLSFQQNVSDELPALPTPADGFLFKPPARYEVQADQTHSIHQQCCISPVWDTPWAMAALLDSGTSTKKPELLKAARWLMKKQITSVYGDWSIKNKKGIPGGWSFEFENDYFPDVDDTLQILSVLDRLDLPREEVAGVFQRGLDWVFSMQSKNGGWAAFDIDNTLDLVNKIPFSDHGACLDPPTPDITARVLELLGNLGYAQEYPACQKALEFILKTQEESGAWWGRWGVNYLYGTWCVLQGLIAMRLSPQHPAISKAVQFIKSVQNSDGGWSESCESYVQKKHVPLPYSTASQTAWALMGLIAAGERDSVEVKKGIEFLLASQKIDGSWDEEAYTGTGFPGHFYIRYHGYRHYFPLMALGKFHHSK